MRECLEAPLTTTRSPSFSLSTVAARIVELISPSSARMGWLVYSRSIVFCGHGPRAPSPTFRWMTEAG